MMAKKIMYSKIPIATQISAALAQLALLGFVPPLNAHTNNMMSPISGMAVISNVTNQSPTVKIGLF